MRVFADRAPDAARLLALGEELPLRDAELDVGDVALAAPLPPPSCLAANPPPIDNHTSWKAH